MISCLRYSISCSVHMLYCYCSQSTPLELSLFILLKNCSWFDLVMEVDSLFRFLEYKSSCNDCSIMDERKESKAFVSLLCLGRLSK